MASSTTSNNGIFIAGHFHGNIAVTNGELDYSGVKFSIGKKSLTNIENLINKFPKEKISDTRRFSIGRRMDERDDDVDTMMGGKSIKKRVRKNRKTKVRK